MDEIPASTDTQCIRSTHANDATSMLEYIATIDPSNANPDGTLPEGAPVLLDAIPISALERIPLSAPERPGPDVLENLDYLLLQAPRGQLPFATNDAPDWFRIEVSQEPRGAAEEFQAIARAIGSPEEREELALWVS